jgi:hypothetical protein
MHSNATQASAEDFVSQYFSIWCTCHTRSSDQDGVKGGNCDHPLRYHGLKVSLRIRNPSSFEPASPALGYFQCQRVLSFHIRSWFDCAPSGLSATSILTWTRSGAGIFSNSAAPSKQMMKCSFLGASQGWNGLYSFWS